MALAPGILSALQQYRLSLMDANVSFSQLHPIFVAWALNGYALWLTEKIAHKLTVIQEIENYLQLHGHPLDGHKPQSPFHLDNPVEAMEEVTRQEVRCSLVIIAAMGLPALSFDRLSAMVIRDLVDEQTEEEATASELLERTRLFYTEPPPPFGLGLLDSWLM